eukprot:3561827-Pleurochrysis_carterae.AAC.1
MQNLCTFTDYARLLQTFGVVERIRELEISTRNDQIRQYAQGCLRNMQMMETMVSPRKEQPNSSLCVDDEHGGEDGGNLSKKKDCARPAVDTSAALRFEIGRRGGELRRARECLRGCWRMGPCVRARVRA